MRIERRSLLAGATNAQGIVVVIDVLRAFSCSSLMFGYGLRDQVLVRTPQEALAFRERDPSYVVAGEMKGVKIEGFDVGNSPKEIIEKGESYFRGKRAALRSTAGTQGVMAASATASTVILGSYTTASAIAKYVTHSAGPDSVVTIVSMGLEGTEKSVEDERCGDYLEHLLAGTPYDHLAALWDCLTDPFIAKSLRDERPHMPKEDVIIALQRDLFDFVMVGRPADGHVRVSRVDV